MKTLREFIINKYGEIPDAQLTIKKWVELTEDYEEYRCIGKDEKVKPKRYTYIDLYHMFWANEEPENKDEEIMLRRVKHFYNNEGYSSRMACEIAAQEHNKKYGLPYSPYEVTLANLEEHAIIAQGKDSVRIHMDGNGLITLRVIADDKIKVIIIKDGIVVAGGNKEKEEAEDKGDVPE